MRSVNGKRMKKVDIKIAERFFRSLKYEEVYLKSYKNLKEARDEIIKYIHIYNTKRIHSAIGYKTPDEIYFSSVEIKQNLDKVA